MAVPQADVERGVLWDSCLAPGGERCIVLVTRSGERIGELALTPAAEGNEEALTRLLTECLNILDPPLRAL